MSASASLDATIMCGQMHSNSTIRSWFSGDAYLLTLPEWGLPVGEANRLWKALGGAPKQHSLVDLGARVWNSLSEAMPAVGKVAFRNTIADELKKIRSSAPEFLSVQAMSGS